MNDESIQHEPFYVLFVNRIGDPQRAQKHWICEF